MTSMRLDCLPYAIVAALLLVGPACNESKFSGTAASQKATATGGPGHDGGGKDAGGKDDAGDGKDAGGKDAGGKDAGGKDAGGKDAADGGGTNGGGKNGAGSDGGADGLGHTVDTGTGGVGADDGGKDAGTIDTENDKIVSKVTISNTISLDGHSVMCLNFKTGELTIRNLHDRFFAARVNFDVTRASGKTATVPLSAPSGTGSAQIPTWLKKCSAVPVMPTARRVSDGNPTALKVFVDGDKSCLDVDDAEGGRPGPVFIEGFDFGAKAC
jgi:hypothetical protein